VALEKYTLLSNSAFVVLFEAHQKTAAHLEACLLESIVGAHRAVHVGGTDDSKPAGSKR
jgi:hypothetical protein